MELSEIKSKLKDRNIKKVSKAVGIHYNTLYKIVSGISEPSHTTLIKLTNYLKG